MTVGEVALKPLFDVLCNNGRQDIAYNVFINAYAPLCENRTTLPESWDGRFSQNHAMLGAGDAFLFEHIAGIKNEGIAFDKITFNPYLPDDISELNLVLNLPNDEVKVHLSRQDGEMNADIKTKIIVL